MFKGMQLRKVVKFNQNKYIVIQTQFFRLILSQSDVKLEPLKVWALWEMPVPNISRNFIWASHLPNTNQS